MNPDELVNLLSRWLARHVGDDELRAALAEVNGLSEDQRAAVDDLRAQLESDDRGEVERAVREANPRTVIVRTTVVYGPDPQRKNYVYQLVRRLRAGERMRVPRDQISSPTYNRDLAAAVVELAPYQGVKNQTAEVRLNGNPVGRFALSDYRHRYKIALPASAQKAGPNRLRFFFGATASPSQDPGNLDKRQLSASFYSLLVGDEAGPAFESWCRRAFAAILDEEEAAVPHVRPLVDHLRSQLRTG